MLAGKMAYEYSMEPGGSLLMDGEGPHGPLEQLDLPIRFLALAAKQDFMGLPESARDTARFIDLFLCRCMMLVSYCEPNWWATAWAYL
ncbi:hypothetical protein ACHMXB_04795 [Arthrobacter sp. UC242_113]|uniref:hypothetical protein n=1 Tax=Arthrobacter sp. UC242_113 TaxID=3374550 RepID=UPI003757C5A7